MNESIKYIDDIGIEKSECKICENNVKNAKFLINKKFKICYACLLQLAREIETMREYYDLH